MMSIQICIASEIPTTESREYQSFKEKTKKIENQALNGRGDPYDLHTKCKAKLEAIYRQAIKTVSPQVAQDIRTEKGICHRNIFHFCRKNLVAQQKNKNILFRKCSR